MKIICENKTIDMDKFDYITLKNYGNTYQLYAARGILTGQEIARLEDFEQAKKLKEALDTSWSNHVALFDVKEWMDTKLETKEKPGEDNTCEQIAHILIFATVIGVIMFGPSIIMQIL